MIFSFEFYFYEDVCRVVVVLLLDFFCVGKFVVSKGVKDKVWF